MKARLFEFLTKDKNRRVKSEDNSRLSSSSSSFYSSSSRDITSSVFLTKSLNENFSDYVFGEKDTLPIDVALKRIEKYKKRHPEEFVEPLEKMYRNAYPKEKKRLFELFRPKRV